MQEETKGNLQRKMEKTRKFSRRISSTHIVSWSLVIVGAIALVLSVFFVSSILAFAGLGLVFWGVLLLYVSPKEYVKTALLDATTLSLLRDLDEILKERGYKGKAVYLPPKYLKDFESSKVYLTAEKTAKLPPPEQIQQKEAEALFSNPDSTLLKPPGMELMRLFENTLGTSLARVDLQFLESNLPKLFIEDLEIAENVKIETKSNKIWVRVGNSVYMRISNELKNLSFVVNLLGCPVSSAIACALAKATGKPVVIERYQVSDDGRTTSIVYQLLED